ncbi:hypothetical protein [Micromonospora arida]|uniref:hypothetical protein n=1 Tax=Micromonospora arida TaxID=2203715 RepID=UPI0033B29975
MRSIGVPHSEGKHEIVVLPHLGEGCSLCLLPFLVFEESEPGDLGQRQHRLRVFSLGVLDVELPGNSLDGLLHP